MAKLLTKSAADRAKQLLANLFRVDGLPLKGENVSDMLDIYWYAQHGSAPKEEVTLEQKANVFLETIAAGVKAEWVNGKTRQASEAAAASARTEIDDRDWTEGDFI